MKKSFNRFLDTLATFIAHRKGLLPIIGLILVILNWLLPLIIDANFITQTNLLLHLGIVIAIIGFLLGWSL